MKGLRIWVPTARHRSVFHVEPRESKITWLKVTVYYERRNFLRCLFVVTWQKEAGLDDEDEDGRRNIYIWRVGGWLVRSHRRRWPENSLEPQSIRRRTDSLCLPTAASSHHRWSNMNLLYYHAKKDVNRKHQRQRGCTRLSHESGQLASG